MGTFWSHPREFSQCALANRETARFAGHGLGMSLALLMAVMTTKTSIGLWLFIAVLIGAVVILHGEPQLFPDSQAVVQFQRDADRYAFLHRQIERRLPAIEITAEAMSIQRAIDAMASAMRAARPEAREGDLFKPRVRQLLRHRIVSALDAHELTAADLESGEGLPPAGLLVHDDMPWRLTTATPACVLEALPPLPAELQYRFVGADLVLVDVHAGLIVDILRGAALPLETTR